MLFCFGIFTEQNTVLGVANIVLFLSIYVNYSKAISENIVFICFLLMIAYFCAATPIAVSLGYDYSFTITSVNNYIDLMLKVIYVATFSSYLGYSFSARVRIKTGRDTFWNNSFEHISIEKEQGSRIYKLIFPLYCVSAIARIYVSIIKWIYSGTVLYSTYHLGVQEVISSIPSIIVKVSSAYEILLFCLLATFVEWKKIKGLFVVDFIISFIIFMAGVRTDFAKSLMIFFIYIVMYSSSSFISDEEKIKLKKVKKKVLMFIPVFLVASTFLQFIRSQIFYRPETLLDLFADTLLGNESAQMIAHAEIFDSELPRTGLYCLGDLRLWLHNSIFGTVFGATPYRAHSVELARAGVAFGQTVAYLVMPDHYLSGAAMGSSFIAELYADFKFIGVFLGSVLYGFLIRFTDKLPRNNYYLRVISMLLISTIIYSPRSGFSTPITALTSLINIFVLLLIYVIDSNNRQRRAR